MARISDDVPSTRPAPAPTSVRHPAVALFQALCIAFLCAATALADDAPELMMPADRIFRGGHIVTVDPGQPEVEALAIAQGVIIAVGDLKTVMERHGPGTEVIELNGKTVMPGLVEAHTHVMMTAFNTHFRALINGEPGPYLVTDLSSFAEKWPEIGDLKRQLRDALSSVPEGGWLLGFGVDPSRTTPFMATLDVHVLDDVSKDVPIFVLNQSGHFAYVNTPAFVQAGILNPVTGVIAPDPGDGGRYLRNKKGELTGVVAESKSYEAFQKAWLKSPTGDLMTPEARLAALRTTYRCFAADGITTATELSLGTAMPGATDEFGLLWTLAGEEDTPIRIRAYAAAVATKPNEANLLTKLQNPRYFPKFPLEMFKLLGIKFVEDGSTQGLSAALGEAYLYPNDTKDKGHANYVTDELVEFATTYTKMNPGWQLAIHSNGDESTQRVLDAYDKLFGNLNLKTREERAKRRWRIDHFTVVHKDKDRDQIERVWELGLLPNMTIGHVGYWGNPFAMPQVGIDGPANPILGWDRAKQIDPAKWLLDRKIPFSFNSDSPVSPAKPLQFISTAVTRRYQKGGDKPLGEEQKIPVDAAIRAVTIDAAYQLFLDDKIGSLKVGKWADLVVLEKNPLDAKDAKDIASIAVLETWLKGSKKYSAPRPPDCNPR